MAQPSPKAVEQQELDRAFSLLNNMPELRPVMSWLRNELEKAAKRTVAEEALPSLYRAQGAARWLGSAVELVESASSRLEKDRR